MEAEVSLFQCYFTPSLKRIQIAAFDYSVICIAKQIIKEKSLSGRQAPRATANFMRTLAAVVKKQMELQAKDLELFAKHAKRSVISVDDVKLCVRRNPDLQQHLQSFIKPSSSTKSNKATTEIS
jgi:histone H3/H4